MKTNRWLIAIFAVLLLTMPAAWAGGDTNLLMGQRALSDDMFDRAGVDDQEQIGLAVSLDFDWPVALALDVLTSNENYTRAVQTDATPLALYTDIDALEVDVGVRKFWGDKVRPYIGGGVAYIQLDCRQIESGFVGEEVAFTDVIMDNEDSGVGVWVNAGFVYRLREHMNLGVDLRYSDADVDVTPAGGAPDMPLDAGGVHYGFALGYHW